jgi:alkanesulfonate monooxygenase SsuD/methylene tetrahydromethanopterin reductase-like flavin-dependent oxidoreductase (luciferase family)
VTFVPTLPPERLREMAVAADSSGLDDLWLWEDCFKQSGLASAAAGLAWTGRIRVGIGLMPAPLRNVALAAMEIATLDRMFPGRFVAAVGHGVQDWMGQAGARVESPMTLLAEYVGALRGLLAGETLTTTGRYVQLDQVALSWPPDTAPPLLLGGFGPKTLEFAARLGQGTMLGSSSVQEVRRACDLVAAVRGQSETPHEVVVGLFAATGPGAAARVDAEVARFPGIAAAGDAESIAASVRELADLGVTAVSIQPTADEPDLTGLIRFLGEEVRPLLDKG